MKKTSIVLFLLSTLLLASCEKKAAPAPDPKGAVRIEASHCTDPAKSVYSCNVKADGPECSCISEAERDAQRAALRQEAVQTVTKPPAESQ